MSVQNNDLAKKVNDIQVQLEMLNDKLTEMMENADPSKNSEHDSEHAMSKVLERATTFT